jgi:branched-chain amino acid transport system substrate-binding protein
MVRPKWRFGFVIIASVICLLFSVSQSAFSADKVKIGVLSALQQKPGQNAKWGAIMAADEINAQGGILGKQIELAFADEEETPEKGIQAVKKLAMQDKVDVLTGGFTSGVTLAQMDYFSRYKLIYLGIGSSSPEITKRVKENYDKYKYVFRVNPLKSTNLAYTMAMGIIDLFGKQLGVKKIAILAEKAKWTEPMVGYLSKVFTENGMEPVMAEFFEVKTNDFSPIFSKVRSSDAQMIVEILSHAQDVFIKQYYDQRVPIPVGGISVHSQASDFYERTGGRCVGETVMIDTLRAPLTPKTITFWDGFVKRWGKDPIYTGIGAYQALHIYKDAVKRAGTFDTEKVIKSLEQTDYTGIYGRVVFDESHDLKYGPEYVMPIFTQWKKGGGRTIVWPKGRAEGSLVFPEWVKLPK